MLSSDTVLDIARRAIWVMLEVGAPALLAALITGVAISLLQALTQIQEMTLSFVPKLVVVFLAMLLSAPFAISALATFTQELFAHIAAGPLG